MSAPAFLNKPKHKDNVIATPRGWVVEKTGELLVSVKNLDQRIAEHLGLPTFNFGAGLAAQIDESIVADLTADVASVVGDIDIDKLLSGLADAPVTEVTKLPEGTTDLPPVVEAPAIVEPAAVVAPVVPDAPVIVKKKLGRPPKIRPVEGEAVVAPAPVAKVEDKPAEEPAVETKAVLEA